MKKPEIDRNKIYSSSEIIRVLEADGWQLHGIEGSHCQFRHPVKKGKVTVKHPVGNRQAFCLSLPGKRRIHEQA